MQHDHFGSSWKFFKNAANLNEVPCIPTNDWQLLGKHSAFSTHLKTELTPATAIREMNFQAFLC